jgi:hypothetical protein
VPEQEGVPGKVCVCHLFLNGASLFYPPRRDCVRAESVSSEEFLVQRVYPRCKVFAQSAHFAPNYYKLNED